MLGSEGVDSPTLPSDPGYHSTGIYDERQSDWSTELRFTSVDAPDARWSWVGGIFWQHDREDADTHYDDDFDALARYLSGGTENSLNISARRSFTGPIPISTAGSNGKATWQRSAMSAT